MQGLGNTVPAALPIIRLISTVPRTAKLSSEELINLHQIAGYIRTMVRKGIWKEEVLACISPVIRTVAEQWYKKSNVGRHADIQEELAEMLKQKGVNTVAGQYVDTMFQPELMSANRRVALVVEDHQMVSEDGFLRGREFMKRFEAANMDVVVVKAKEWKEMEDKAKQERIKQIAKVMSRG